MNLRRLSANMNAALDMGIVVDKCRNDIAKARFQELFDATTNNVLEEIMSLTDENGKIDRNKLVEALKDAQQYFSTEEMQRIADQY